MQVTISNILSILCKTNAFHTFLNFPVSWGYIYQPSWYVTGWMIILQEQIQTAVWHEYRPHSVRWKWWWCRMLSPKRKMQSWSFNKLYQDIITCFQHRPPFLHIHHNNTTIMHTDTLHLETYKTVLWKTAQYLKKVTIKNFLIHLSSSAYVIKLILAIFSYIQCSQIH